MANPNNNMNAYNQALIINRDLKKRIDRANEIIDNLREWKYNETDDYEDALNKIKEVLNGWHKRSRKNLC